MKNHICPWYVGYVLASPLRRLFLNPERLLSPFVREGMKVLEVGPGMGFFTIPLAKLVGEGGQIICVDVQEKMLRKLKKSADKKGLLWRIETRLCSSDSLQIDDLKGMIDFVLAFAVVHEVPDQKKLFAEIYTALKSDGLVMLAEPAGHVFRSAFEDTVSVAEALGFKQIEVLKIKRNHAVILKKF